MTRTKRPCPTCGYDGKPVRGLTVESLVLPASLERVSDTEGFAFCATPTCAVVYFDDEQDCIFTGSDLRVPVGAKQGHAPRTLCYCFGHTKEAIQAEVRAAGDSRVPTEVADKCKRGLDRCATENPKGSCCLGDLQRAVAEARAKFGLPPPTSTKRRAGGLATAGALTAAILSSACCWLPLLLVGLGTSAVGVAGFFESWRPWLLAGAAVLLAAAWSLTWLRRERCAPGDACATPRPRMRSLRAGMLALATLAVAAFAFFPSYVGVLLGATTSPSEATASAGEPQVYTITGMTCEGCAVTLESALGELPGIARAEVSYDEKIARLYVEERATPPKDEAVLRAVAEAGYVGRRR